MPFEQTRELMQQAEVVIAHAGTGTVMLALAEGKCPIVAPRFAKFGEHVDDHQQDLVKTLEANGSIISYLPGDDLAEKIALAKTLTAKRLKDPDATLVEYLRTTMKLA